MPHPPKIPSKKLQTRKKIFSSDEALLGLLKKGFTLHQQGKASEAQQIYEKVLLMQSDNFDAINLLGILSLESGNYLNAYNLFARATSINPKNAGCYLNLGLCSKELNRHLEAINSYDKAIVIKPDYAHAYNNRAISLHELQRYEEALSSYERAIELKSDYFEAYNNLGNTLNQLQRYEEAITYFDRAIHLKPDYFESLNNRGNALQQLQRYDDALASYDHAIDINPQYPQAFYNKGSVFLKLLRYEEALACIDHAINIKPDYPDAHNNRGICFQKIQRFEEALACYDQAILILPKYAEAHNNRGNVLQKLHRHQDAIASFNYALELKPDYAEAYSNRSISLNNLELFEEALLNCDQAIQLKPDYAEAYNNKGNVLQKLNRLDEAISYYNFAIELNSNEADFYNNRGTSLLGVNRTQDAILNFNVAIYMGPDNSDAQWNLSLAQLLSANFRDGWKQYEWRWQSAEVKHTPVRSFFQPLWLGNEDLGGKTILLHAEQGLGDTLQFCRYAQLVSSLNSKVILEVQPPLAKLLGGLKGDFEVIPQGGPIPGFDYHCPLLSLPLAFNTDSETIPLPALIQVNKDKLAYWKNHLGLKKKPRIGIVWSGNSAYKNDRKRSLALSELIPYLPTNYDYFCLQKEIRDHDKEILTTHSHIKYFTDLIEDFSDTAAVCELMDLVISVDTSVAHLAGTMQKPTYILLPYSPDWRWQLDRADSPWYPSVRLYRQISPGDWSTPLENLHVNLKNL
ncbi:tetratricopeptide repeat protein [Polynucleobacter paneuropaeus]|nr:tetratricopeptide repeat protein [Polynucleobacter paneuropaeus]